MASNVLNVAKMDFIVPGLCEIYPRGPGAAPCPNACMGGLRAYQYLATGFTDLKKARSNRLLPVQYSTTLPPSARRVSFFSQPKVCQKSHTDTHSHSHKDFTHQGAPARGRFELEGHTTTHNLKSVQIVSQTRLPFFFLLFPSDASVR